MNTKQISLDNGHSFLTAEEAAQEIAARNLWETVVWMMDEYTRNAVAWEGFDSPAQFLARYLELAPDDLIIG